MPGDELRVVCSACECAENAVQCLAIHLALRYKFDCAISAHWAFLCTWGVALRIAIYLLTGRVGHARRVGHLIFKKQMPSCFAHGRYLEYIKAQGM